MQNCQSLTANFDEFSHFILDRQPVIMCLTETHLTDQITDREIDVENYRIARVDSNSRSTGGVMCYFRRDVKYTIIGNYSVPYAFWVLLCKATVSSKTFLLGVVYRSPSSPERVFLDFFSNFMGQHLVDQENDIIILGDYNINVNKKETYSNQLKQLLQDNSLKQIVGENTHISCNGSESLIDLVVCNCSAIIDCQVLKTHSFNRHSLIRIDIGGNRDVDIRNKSITFREKLKNLDQFTLKLTSIFSGFDYREQDLSKKYDVFYQSLMSAIDELMPKKTIYTRVRYNPWINEEIIKELKIRDNALKRFRLTKDTNELENYKSLRNRVTNKIRKSKCEFYETNIDGVKSDAKLMWKTLKSMLSGKTDEGDCSEIKHNDVFYTDPGIIPEIFNHYYIDSIKEIVNSIPHSAITDEILPVRMVGEWRSFSLLNEQKLKTIVSSLPSKGSPNEIRMSILKNCFESISNPLINIINYSLETGTIPDQFKRTTIVPIRKIAKTKLISEYRPINTVSSETKILEKTVCEQLLNHISKYNILVEYQSGFRQEHNTESVLQYIIDEWKNNIDMDESTVVVFLDLKRAFETVDRDRLIKKLENYGIADTVLKWFGNYLQGRKQVVKCGSFVSEELQNDIGIPQGTILGPILFSLYINDLGLNLKYASYHLFADDTVIFINGKSKMELETRLNEDLGRLTNWLKINKLKLNTSKSKVMIIERKPIVGYDINISIDNTKIEIVQSIKYLGVIIDNNLKFGEHVDYVCKKVSKKLGFFYRCGKYLSPWARRTVYNTIIMPHFNYASTILYLVNKSDIARLQLLQNRAMRIILRCNRYTSINTMLMTLNWFNIQEYLEINSLKFIHKIHLKLLPQYCINKLSTFKDIHDHNTRGRDNFILDHKNKKSTQNSIFFKTVCVYNKLPISIKESQRISEFVRKLKQYYREKR